MRRLIAASIAALAMAMHAAAQEPPLPNRDAFFSATEQNLVKAQREQVHYAYRERRTDLHVNPFGRIGTGGTRVYDVKPGPAGGVFYRTLVERDGTPVTDSKPERVERRRERTSSKRDPIDEALQVFDFRMERREVVDGRSLIVVSFTPKRDADPDSREAKLASQFKGEAWVDESAREVARVEAVAVDDLSFGFGLIARLNEGTRVTVTRARADDIAWLPTSVRFKGEGRAMLFRKLLIDFGIEWFDYRRVQ